MTKKQIDYPITIEKCRIDIPGVTDGAMERDIYCLPRECEPNRFASITQAKKAWRKHLAQLKAKERADAESAKAFRAAAKRTNDGYAALCAISYMHDWMDDVDMDSVTKTLDRLQHMCGVINRKVEENDAD